MLRLLAEVILICCVVASSRSSEDARPTLPSAPTTISTLISPSIISSAPATALPEDQKHKPSQLPIDLLSEDKVLLDPNVVLARVVRDTYAGWSGYRQSFSKPYQRTPFGIQGYYNLQRPAPASPRPDTLKRRNDLRRRQALAKPFRLYPVFPG